MACASVERRRCGITCHQIGAASLLLTAGHLGCTFQLRLVCMMTMDPRTKIIWPPLQHRCYSRHRFGLDQRTWAWERLHLSCSMYCPARETNDRSRYNPMVGGYLCMQLIACKVGPVAVGSAARARLFMPRRRCRLMRHHRYIRLKEDL